MQPVRIVFFVSTLAHGGAEKHLVRVVNHLDPSRFAVRVAVANPGGSYEQELASHVQLVRLNRKPQRSSTLGLLRAAPALRALLQGSDVDVLVSVLDHASVVAGTVVQSISTRIPWVVCVQNNVSEKYVRRANRFRRAQLWAMRALFPRADKVIALSHGVAGDLAQLMPPLADRITVIHNAGIDDALSVQAAEPLEPARLSAPRPLLLACGRLVEQKGYPVLLDAFQRVRARVPAHLWILGDGPQRAEIERRIAELGLGSSVELLGFQRNPFRFMANADVFVLSSLFEGFGNVVTEAMAAGTATVATRCPYGPEEIIEDGVSGLLVPVGDAPALADALVRVVEDPALRSRLAQRGRERAEAFHARRIAGLYGAVLATLHNEAHGEPSRVSAPHRPEAPPP